MSKPASETLSKTISFLRFPMIVGIVLIHAQNQGLYEALGGKASDIPVYMFIQNSFSLGICSMCVPLFFLISGYLFFVNTEWSWNAYLKKLKRRVNSLLVPYILYTVVALIVFGILQQLMPSLISEGKTPIADYGIREYAEAFWMYNNLDIPFVGPFWFIRDLMVLHILTPLIYVLVKYGRWWGLSIILVLYFFNIPCMSDLLFFSTGVFFALNNMDFGGLFSKWKAVWLVYPIVLVADTLSKECDFTNYLHKVAIILGLITFVGLAWRYVRKNGNIIPSYLSVATFFVYAAHEPYLDQVRKVVFRVLSLSQNQIILETEMISCYITIPFAFMALLVIMYHVIAKLSPALAGVLSGNR